MESMPEAYAGTSTSVSKQMESGVQLESFFSNWNDLLVAVRDQPANRRDCIFFPESTLIATSSPVVIDAGGITIKCGAKNDMNCFISDGYSHFHIVGLSKGVTLERLIISRATGSSIMAFRNKGAKSIHRDCDFMKNEGGNAIYIHNEQTTRIPANGPLVIMNLLLSTPTAAMTVEVINCVFANNDLIFGTIASIGGTLTVRNSRFNKNSGSGGDIVVSNYGDSEAR